MTPERRRAAPAALLALALLLAAACGGGGGDSSDGDDDTAAEGEGAGDDQRIVLLAEEPILADVLELGVRPIASTAAVDTEGFQGLDGYDIEGIEVLPMTTLSLEHLASLRADVIITLQFWVDQVEEEPLRGSSELLIVPDGLPVVERVRTLGEMLDREDEAEALVAEVEAATERARAAVPDDCRVSLAAVYSGPNPAAFVDGPWDLPSAILDSGCTLDPGPDEATPDRNGRVYLSQEQLGLLDAPEMVLLQSEAVDGEAAALEEIAGDPLWQGLPAVRSGDVTTFDRLGYPGATGQVRFLDEFAAAFD